MRPDAPAPHLTLLPADDDPEPVLAASTRVQADAVAIAQPTISGNQPVPQTAQRELAVVPGFRRGVAA